MTIYILTSQYLHEEPVVRGVYTSLPAVQAAEAELRNHVSSEEDPPMVYWDGFEADVFPVSRKKWMED